MGKIRKALAQQEKEQTALKTRRAIPKKEEEWDVSEEGFYKDDIEDWNDAGDHLMLDPTADLEAASFSEEESDNEVLPLDLPDNSDDEEDRSDASERDSESADDAGLPSHQAWGHRKSSFYDANFGGDESIHSSDESMAEEEEKEAMELQRRLMDSLDNKDYGLESFRKLQQQTSRGKPSGVGSATVAVTKELSSLSEEEQYSLLQQQWPEFIELHGDLQDRLQYIKNTLDPLIEILSSSQSLIVTGEGLDILKAMRMYSALYCLNVGLYVVLRSSGTSTEDHPVIGRIVELRDILGKLSTALGGEEKIESVHQIVQTSSVTSMQTEKANPRKRKVKQNKGEAMGKKKKRKQDKKDDEDPLEYYNRIKNSKKKVSFVDVPSSTAVQHPEEGKEDGKRGISYQMATNKGLTPKRKKEQRNPRVKHRKKYVKAVKKYRKVSRPVERELERYGGEKGGIKSRLSRSVKIK